MSETAVRPKLPVAACRLSETDWKLAQKACRAYRTAREYKARKNGQPRPDGLIDQLQRIERTLSLAAKQTRE